MGSLLKNKTLLQQEQILSVKSQSPLEREANKNGRVASPEILNVWKITLENFDYFDSCFLVLFTISHILHLQICA